LSTVMSENLALKRENETLRQQNRKKRSRLGVVSFHPMMGISPQVQTGVNLDPGPIPRFSILHARKWERAWDT
jgi:hypothetical protein